METAKATAKSEETRRRILEAALTLFREKGFDETSMREIAAAAGAATGAAYYYFDSKEALVMAFYERAQEELEPLIRPALAAAQTLQAKLRAIVNTKFEYFSPNRRFLGALNRHVADPRHPLSPLSPETQSIRDRDIALFAEALEAARGIPKDLRAELPRLLWSYQMSLILFWIYDRSPAQSQTARLVDASLPLVTALINLGSLPLTRPVRKRVLGVVRILAGE